MNSGTTKEQMISDYLYDKYRYPCKKNRECTDAAQISREEMLELMDMWTEYVLKYTECGNCGMYINDK